MAETTSRTAARLARELRALRELAGLNQLELSRQLQDAQVRGARSQAAVSRIESGQGRPPSRSLVQAWARLTEASDDDTERVLVLVDAVHGETRPWDDLDDSGHLQGIAAGREHEATRIRDCALTWLPGLCQTAEYARLLIPQVAPPGDHAAAVDARMKRQQILYRGDRTFEFLISEHAARWAPGPGVMTGQRAMLATIATLSDVQLRVLRSDRVGAPEWENFIIYDIADDEPPLVVTEALQGQWQARDSVLSTSFEQVWSELWGAALHGDEAVEFIRSIG